MSAPRSSANTRELAQRLGHFVLSMNPQREPFGERRLADAGLADQQRVVLPPPAEHLHHALELGLAADQRIDLPLAARADQIGGKRLERIRGARLVARLRLARRARLGLRCRARSRAAASADRRPACGGSTTRGCRLPAAGTRAALRCRPAARSTRRRGRPRARRRDRSRWSTRA